MKSTKSDNGKSEMEPEASLEVMRGVFEGMGVELEESEGGFEAAIEILEGVDARIRCDEAGVMEIVLEEEVAPESMGVTGELLHRLNGEAEMAVWVLDYEKREVRLRVSMGLLELGEGTFAAVLEAGLSTAETIAPFILAVMEGRMRPGVAAEQASGAALAYCQRG